jgi:hypothetical protein
MKEDPDLIDGLVKRLTEFGLTYQELVKLKIVNKATNIISAIFPDLIVTTLFMIFLLFLNLGLALWLGDVLGKIYFGFLAVSLLYLMLGFFSHFFMRNRFKKAAENYFIKQFFR